MEIVEFQFIVVSDDHASSCHCDFCAGDLLTTFEVCVLVNEFGDCHGRLKFVRVRIRVFSASKFIDFFGSDFKVFVGRQFLVESRRGDFGFGGMCWGRSFSCFLGFFGLDKVSFVCLGEGGNTSIARIFSRRLSSLQVRCITDDLSRLGDHFACDSAC